MFVVPLMRPMTAVVGRLSIRVMARIRMMVSMRIVLVGCVVMRSMRVSVLHMFNSLAFCICIVVVGMNLVHGLNPIDF